MFGFIAEKAKSLGGAVGEAVTSAGEVVVSAKDSVVGSVSHGASAASSQMEAHWPAVEKLLVDGLLTVTHDSLKNDEVFLVAIEKAFELLPAPIRLLLPRSTFITFSLARRNAIVQRLQAHQESRLLLGNAKAVEVDVDV
ncbi:hypothetical protein NPS46_22655 [Pseudomonas putida]|uniref:hypothetical protein n=1 Tax=Pseudomonas putida TaxID=303 RepID=UPI002363C125|nr:hypothetical protein [Pseudomonas putida]MDD2055357.1 hypothetical protein [Pseudomonas putida]